MVKYILSYILFIFVTFSSSICVANNLNLQDPIYSWKNPFPEGNYSEGASGAPAENCPTLQELKTEFMLKNRNSVFNLENPGIKANPENLGGFNPWSITALAKDVYGLSGYFKVDRNGRPIRGDLYVISTPIRSYKPVLSATNFANKALNDGRIQYVNHCVYKLIVDDNNANLPYIMYAWPEK